MGCNVAFQKNGKELKYSYLLAYFQYENVSANKKVLKKAKKIDRKRRRKKAKKNREYTEKIRQQVRDSIGTQDSAAVEALTKKIKQQKAMIEVIYLILNTNPHPTTKELRTMPRLPLEYCH